jgi:hypothetical protein
MTLRKAIGSFVILLLSAFRPAPAHAQDSAYRLPLDLDRVARLESHGIPDTPQTLLAFVEAGFPPNALINDLPATPTEKTQLLIDAIVELTRQQVAQSVPVLLTLARGVPSAGMRRILQYDADLHRSGESRRFEEKAVAMLRLNAVVALGLIGGANLTADLTEVFNAERDPALKAAAALALASLGSSAGIGYLVEQAAGSDRATAAEAGTALEQITGQRIGPGPDDSAARRDEAAAQWRAWWKQNRKNFQPNRTAILARRLAAKPPRVLREPTTPRDLLDAMCYPEDPRWSLDPYFAYEKLSRMGTAAIEPLEAIIGDKRENIRIRRQAILAYGQLVSPRPIAGAELTDAERRAQRLFRGLRRDRDPEIREVAKQAVRRLAGE